jgi:hypothetical protein
VASKRRDGYGVEPALAPVMLLGISPLRRKPNARIVRIFRNLIFATDGYAWAASAGSAQDHFAKLNRFFA